MAKKRSMIFKDPCNDCGEHKITSAFVTEEQAIYFKIQGYVCEGCHKKRMEELKASEAVVEGAIIKPSDSEEAPEAKTVAATQ